MVTRRRFLVANSLVGAAFAGRLIPSSAAGWAFDLEHAAQIGQQDPRAAVTAALDAARQAGAVYADVQLCRAQQERWNANREVASVGTRVTEGVTVRAYVQDCWGVAAAHGVVAADSLTQLARDAVAQARIGGAGSPQVLPLASAPSVANGHWTMPVEIDPLTVSAAEKWDVLAAMCDVIVRNRFGLGVFCEATFRKEDRTMASTDGTYVTQTLFNTTGRVSLQVGGSLIRYVTAWTGDFLSPAGAGWEYILRAPVRDRAPVWIAMADRHRHPKPVDIGRADVVFDAYATAAMLDATLGRATALDRAMGVRANDTNTSFLSDPLAMLGTLAVAAPGVTISMNRALPRGAATVRWDGDGVAPRDATLVEQGVLTDFQTTRESAMWLAPAYQRLGRTVHSNGCAGSGSVTALPEQCMPNLALAPGANATSFEDLVKATRRGYAIIGGQVRTDWQALNGMGYPAQMFEIRDGQLANAVDYNVAYLFRAPEFWKSVRALGGARSAQSFGFTHSSNEEAEPRMAHTVTAVPMQVAQLRIGNLFQLA